MDKFIRTEPPDSLEILKQKWQDWGREYCASRKLDWRRRCATTGSFINMKRLIRQSLYELTDGRCAFCGQNVFLLEDDDEMYMTIEHFLPKSKHCRHTYEWENLYPCCRKCNESKSCRFEYELLKPDSKDYSFEEFFYINEDGIIEESGPQKERGKVTIDLYDLNRSNLKFEREEIMNEIFKEFENGDVITKDYSYLPFQYLIQWYLKEFGVI